MADRLSPEQEQMFEEWRKKATPAHVAQYVTRELPDDSEAKWLPFGHHLYMNDVLVEDATSPERTFLNMSVAVRMGKALADHEEILTPDGWRKMGDLRAGDEVYAPDGAATRVLAIAPQAPALIYRVRFDDGSQVDAHAEHEWVTFDVRASSSYQRTYKYLHGHRVSGYPADWWNWRSSTGIGAETVSTAEMLATLTDRRGHLNHRVPVSAPVEGREVDLPIDPWLLGYWLGNGNKAHANVACGSEIGGGRPDLPWVKQRIEAAGWTPTDQATPNTLGIPKLKAALRDLGVLGNKHVPEAYLRSSEAQRRELLAGLMDADGGVERTSRSLGTVSFTSTDVALTDAAAELLVSLGAKIHRNDRPAILNGRQYGRAYRVSSSPPFNPFSLPRKAEGWAAGRIIRCHRMVTDVEVLAPGSTTCIQVAHPSGMFLAGRSLIPTHNSELISRYLPFWYLGMFPDRDVVIIMNTTENAEKWGLATRNLMREYGPELFGLTVDPSNEGKRSWGIKGRKGTFRAVGIGTAIEGRGIHLGIIDDPLGFEEAMSPAERQKVWDWYTGQYRTRLMHGSTTVLVMSRWHMDDLAGRIERHQAEHPGGDPWRTVMLPVIAQAPKGAGPEWRNPIGQADGEPLWPERWPLDDLAILRKSVTAQTWESRYMQNPTNPEGGAFKVASWMSRPHVDRSQLRLIRMWDLAATEGDGDWTVGLLMGLDRENRVYIVDIQRFRKDAAGVKKQVLATAQADGRFVPVGIEQERAGAGKAQLADMKRLLFGYVVVPIKPDGKKEDRAAPYAAQQQDSNVYIVGDLDGQKEVFIEEHRVFPKGTHDDMVDAASAAFNWLAEQAPAEIIQPQEYGAVPLDRMMEMGFGGARQGFNIPVG